MIDFSTVRRSRVAAVLPGAIAFLTTLGVIGLTFDYLKYVRIIDTDLGIYALPEIQRQFGSVYVDFFDIKPPLLFQAFTAWISVFGSSLIGFWLAYAIAIAVMFAALWLLIRVYLRPWWALGVFVSAQILIVGQAVLEAGQLQFTPEVPGLALVFAGLFVGLRWGSTRLMWLCVAALTMSLAAGFKEVFVLAPLALLPVVLMTAKGRVMRVAVLGAGVLAGYLATGVVLLTAGSGVLGAYLDVLEAKRVLFPLPGVQASAALLSSTTMALARWMPLTLLGLTTLIAFVLVTRRQPLRTEQRMRVWAAWLLLIVLFVGYLWQGKQLWSHYALVVVLPIFVVFAALLEVALERLPTMRPAWRIPLFGLVGVALLTSVGNATWTAARARSLDPVALANSARTLESPADLAQFTEIADLVSEEACIHVAYGWAAASTYLYSVRRPCTRFVVPGLDLTPALVEQLRAQLRESPPALMVVDPKAPGLGASVAEIDRRTVPLSAVAATCYQPVPGAATLFIPRAVTVEGLRGCIDEQLGG